LSIIKVPFSLRSLSGKNINGDISYIDDGIVKPIVIVCHGFMAFKDWGMYPFVGEEFAKQGFISVVFNFSHNGINERLDRITDFEAFENNTISKELLDIRSVIDQISIGSLYNENFDKEKIILVSHSRGCGVAIVHASKDHRVKGLATWSPISTFDRWNEKQKKRWRENGFLPASNQFITHPLKLGIGLLNDIENNFEQFNIQKAAEQLEIPWLILQGTEDLITPKEEAEILFSLADKTRTQYILLEQTGHLYNALNEKTNDTTTVQYILDLTTTFLHTHL